MVTFETPWPLRPANSTGAPPPRRGQRLPGIPPIGGSRIHRSFINDNPRSRTQTVQGALLWYLADIRPELGDALDAFGASLSQPHKVSPLS